ncbi:MAG: YkgJ family cysteine cluster protein [Armatimonadetes bacterium]|nr:YkgJ family cysteine cluster protein [Armatimonadota bacterium]
MQKISGAQAQIDAQLDGIRLVASAFAGSWLHHSNPSDRLPKVFSKLAISCDDAISEFERQRVATGDTFTLACKSGCDYCCRQFVVATPMEVFALVAWLKENRTPSEIDQIRQRANSYLELFLDNDPSLLNYPCPVLEGGMCQGYGGRPFICRGYHSFNLEACEKKYEKGDSSTTIPFNRPAYLTAAYMRISVAARIADLKYPSAQVFLGPALAVVLRLDDGLERWLKGENLFSGLEFKGST